MSEFVKTKSEYVPINAWCTSSLAAWNLRKEYNGCKGAKGTSENTENK
jgi:hypothetical protein